MVNSLETLKAAFEKGKEELNYAIYLEDCGGNAGIRKINSNKVDWLKYVMYLAEIGLYEVENTVANAKVDNAKSCVDCSDKYKNIIAEKDYKIVELENKINQLESRFGSKLSKYLNKGE